MQDNDQNTGGSGNNSGGQPVQQPKPETAPKPTKPNTNIRYDTHSAQEPRTNTKDKSDNKD